MNELENFLFRRNQNKEYQPQRIFTYDNKKVGAWFPYHTKPKKKNIINYDMLGYTGRVYKNLYSYMANQDCYQCFACIDIDYKDNKKYEVSEFHNKITSLLPDENIRTSSSGKGIHIIQIFETPQHFPVNSSNSQFSNLTKEVSKKNIEILSNNNIIIDKCTATVYFLQGKEQHWLRISDKLYKVEHINEQNLLPHSSNNSTYLSIEIFDDTIQRFFNEAELVGLQIKDKHVSIKYNLCMRYIVPVVERRFNTKILTNSTMKNNDINCYLTISKKEILLFAAADNGQPCFKVMNKKYFSK